MILLNLLILPIGGVASERVCVCSQHSRLVFNWESRKLGPHEYSARPSKDGGPLLPFIVVKHLKWAHDWDTSINKIINLPYVTNIPTCPFSMIIYITSSSSTYMTKLSSVTNASTWWNVLCWLSDYLTIFKPLHDLIVYTNLHEFIFRLLSDWNTVY